MSKPEAMNRQISPPCVVDSIKNLKALDAGEHAKRGAFITNDYYAGKITIRVTVIVQLFQCKISHFSPRIVRIFSKINLSSWHLLSHTSKISKSLEIF